MGRNRSFHDRRIEKVSANAALLTLRRTRQLCATHTSAGFTPYDRAPHTGPSTLLDSNEHVAIWAPIQGLLTSMRSAANWTAIVLNQRTALSVDKGSCNVRTYSVVRV